MRVSKTSRCGRKSVHLLVYWVQDLADCVKGKRRRQDGAPRLFSEAYIDGIVRGATIRISNGSAGVSATTPAAAGLFRSWCFGDDVTIAVDTSDDTVDVILTAAQLTVFSAAIILVSLEKAPLLIGTVGTVATSPTARQGSVARGLDALAGTIAFAVAHGTSVNVTIIIGRIAIASRGVLLGFRSRGLRASGPRFGAGIGIAISGQ